MDHQLLQPAISIDPIRRRALGVNQQLLEVSGRVIAPTGTTLLLGLEGDALTSTALAPSELIDQAYFEARLVVSARQNPGRKLMVVATLPDGSQLSDWTELSGASSSQRQATSFCFVRDSSVLDSLRCGNERSSMTTARAQSLLRDVLAKWQPIPEAEIWQRRWPETDAPLQDRPRTKLGASRILIVTTELRGPVRLTDAGTRAMGLAESLAAAGHPVTLLFLAVDSYEIGNLSSWALTLRPRGIDLVELPYKDHDYCIPEYRERGLRVFKALKELEFDVAHFFGDVSIAHFVLYAKRQGIAFNDSTIYVHAGQPEAWLREGNGEYPFSSAQLEREFMQRESIAGADLLVTGSSYMTNWMRESGWPLPSQSRIIETPAPLPSYNWPSEQRNQRPSRTLEIVFVGRISDANGIDLFLATAEELARTAPLNVTFIGPNGKISGTPSPLYLDAWAERHGIRVRRIADYSHHETLLLLVRDGGVALLPYQQANRPALIEEFLRRGIPTVTTPTGGILEITENRERLKVAAPCAVELAAAVRAAAADPTLFTRPQAARDPEDTNRWSRSLWSGPATDLPQTPPLVSICIAHKDRPRFLEQALDSVEAQTYQNVEVIITDDGSEDPEALQLLEAIERDPWRFPRTVVRQHGLLPSGARNVAALHAKGDFLFFLDDDNLMKPPALAKLVDVAARTKADAVTCALDFFASAFIPGEFTKPHSTWVPSGPALELGGLINCYGDTFSLFARESFLALGGFKEHEGGLHEDWEILARAVLGGMRLEVVPEALAWYRYRPEERRDPQFFFRARQISLEPFLAAVPEPLRPILRLVQGIYGAREEPITESLITFAPDERVSTVEVLPRLLYRADDIVGFEGVAPQAGCKLATSRKGLEVMADTDDPGILLPLLDLDGVHQLDLVVEISSTAATTCQLYYLTLENQRYSELQSVSLPIGVGPNSITFKLRDVAMIGALRLDPGMFAGIYVIHSLECRVNSPVAPD